MELASVSNEQLFELLTVIAKEARRRRRLKQDNVLKRLFANYAVDNPDIPIADTQAVSGGGLTPLAIPQRLLVAPPDVRINLLGRLLCQDWSGLFREEDLTAKYYVYAHIEPSVKHLIVNKRYGGPIKGVPFYIGKGTGDRAFDLKRNQSHGKKIDQLRNEGVRDADIVHVFRRCLTERQAFEMEAKLIYFFGTVYEGGRDGTLLNLDISQRPEFKGFILSKKA